MASKWPIVSLGEVLLLHLDSVEVDPLISYSFAGVYSFGRGLFARSMQSGSQTTYKTFNRLNYDDFVISQPKAWEGAIARVTKEFDGHFLSPVFPTFRGDPSRLDMRYLEWYCRQSLVWEQLRLKAKGIGARRESVLPSQFLSLKIPLPSLQEQRRIVEWIEALATKIEETRANKLEIEAQLNQLLMSAYQAIIEKSPRRSLSEIAPLVRRPVAVDINAKYPQVSARSFGKGTFHQPTLEGQDITWQKPFLVKAGDILISNIKAWEGAIAVAKDQDDGRFGSHRYLTCVPSFGVATAAFVCFHLLTPEGLLKIGEASPGSADRNRTLSAEGLMRIQVPVPEYSKQTWFERLKIKVDALKSLQAETITELDAMMPSVLKRAFTGES